MINELRIVRNLGVFNEFSWDNEVSKFARYNVIYGENGSGKTTLSRLFEALSNGGHDDYPNLQYKVATQTGMLVEGDTSPTKIRVFNSDYVHANIGQLDGNLPPILVVGEESKALADALTKEELMLEGRVADMRATTATLRALESNRGKIFTAIARTITEAVSGYTLRTYRKNNAEAAYADIDQPKVLSGEQLEAKRATLRQDQLDSLEHLKLPEFGLGKRRASMQEAAAAILEEARSLVGRSAISSAIDRLKEKPDISAWVEAGLALHHSHASEACEFCGNSISSQRLAELEEHFSAEDQQLKASLEACIAFAGEFDRALAKINVHDRHAFYSELRTRCEKVGTDLTTAVAATRSALAVVTNTLNQKLASRASQFTMARGIPTADLVDCCGMLNSLIDEHNSKTGDFERSKATARDEIESHFLSTIRGEVAEIDDQIERGLRELTILSEGSGQALGVAHLRESIKEKRAAISNAHKAGERLTNLLHTFLGRSELVFQSAAEGYSVLRNGEPAKRLSEGERTAIAFIYFIVHLGDQNFSVEDGIVVVDDPVSSLDSNSTYQAFAFLKNAVKDARQVFLLTHNFGFLRLVLNWLYNDKKMGGKQYYMLICETSDKGRQSRVTHLDTTLQNHPTEYHYLFKILVNFKGDGTIAGCYHIPNVTRKVLETFLDFFEPSKLSPYRKLEAIVFDENKKTSLYKFSNDLSHFTGQGFEPALVQESQKNVAYLLEMIEVTAPQHYTGMMASIDP